MDRFSSAAEYRYLTDKFCTGLQLPGGQTLAIDRIKLFTSTCCNASHASSAMDIVLGAFRYCIHQPQNVEAARVMMAQVVRLLWHTRLENRLTVHGFMRRPREVRVAAYQAEYDWLLEWINSLLSDEE